MERGRDAAFLGVSRILCGHCDDEIPTSEDGNAGMYEVS